MKTKPIYTLILALLVTACSSPEQAADSTEQIDKLTSEQQKAAEIQTAPLRKHLLEQTIRVNGYVDVPPNQKAEVHAMLEGFVSELSVILGDKVKKGQALAHVVSPDFIKLQQAHLEQKTQLKSLELEYKRLKALSDEKISSQKEFLAAESAYLSAKTSLVGTAKQLELLGMNAEKLTAETMQDRLTIRAPVSGEVTRVVAVMGQHITPGEMLFQVVNTDHLHAELKVFENDLGKVAVKMPVRMIINQIGKAVVTGSVYQFSTVINETGRFGMVHVHFDKERSTPQIGAYVEAEIVLIAREVWAVEEAAVISDAQGSRIYVIQPGDTLRITPMPVKTGMNQGGWIELIDMPEGIQYVAKGAYYLANR